MRRVTSVHQLHDSRMACDRTMRRPEQQVQFHQLEELPDALTSGQAVKTFKKLGPRLYAYWARQKLSRLLGR